jgi:hypothetical protein
MHTVDVQNAESHTGTRMHGTITLSAPSAADDYQQARNHMAAPLFVGDDFAVSPTNMFDIDVENVVNANLPFPRHLNLGTPKNWYYSLQASFL